jgi:hypothetical protein
MEMTSSQYFKMLSTLCYALIGGLLVFVAISIVVSSNNIGNRSLIGNEDSVNFIFYIMVAVIALGGIAGSFIIFKNKLPGIKQKGSLAERLQDYRAAVILRYALLEGPGIFSIIVYFLTGEMKVLIATVVIILLMVYSMPNREKLINDLELSSSEAAVINDPNGVIQ